MAKQAQTCYSVQRRLEIATQLYFFDFSDYHELYKTYLPGIDNWNISKNEKMKDNLKNAIYLTAEAEEVLDTVDKGTMYIIGGIVDRNRLPGLCAGFAMGFFGHFRQNFLVKTFSKYFRKGLLCICFQNNYSVANPASVNNEQGT